MRKLNRAWQGNILFKVMERFNNLLMKVLVMFYLEQMPLLSDIEHYIWIQFVNSLQTSKLSIRYAYLTPKKIFYALLIFDLLAVKNTVFSCNLNLRLLSFLRCFRCFCSMMVCYEVWWILGKKFNLPYSVIFFKV